MTTRPTVETQTLTRSCNEALILAALRDGPMHGYQLALHVQEHGAGAFQFQHGTLYPILHRLEKQKLIRGSWSAEGAGRKRKSYSLTAAGRRYAEAQLKSWRHFVDCFFAAVEA